MGIKMKNNEQKHTYVHAHRRNKKRSLLRFIDILAEYQM